MILHNHFVIAYLAACRRSSHILVNSLFSLYFSSNFLLTVSKVISSSLTCAFNFSFSSMLFLYTSISCRFVLEYCKAQPNFKINKKKKKITTYSSTSSIAWSFILAYIASWIFLANAYSSFFINKPFLFSSSVVIIDFAFSYLLQSQVERELQLQNFNEPGVIYLWRSEKVISNEAKWSAVTSRSCFIAATIFLYFSTMRSFFANMFCISWPYSSTIVLAFFKIIIEYFQYLITTGNFTYSILSMVLSFSSRVCNNFFSFSFTSFSLFCNLSTSSLYV